jgi:hypothetical protein
MISYVLNSLKIFVENYSDVAPARIQVTKIVYKQVFSTLNFSSNQQAA